jgi:hypothetical protein
MMKKGSNNDEKRPQWMKIKENNYFLIFFRKEWENAENERK